MKPSKKPPELVPRQQLPQVFEKLVKYANRKGEEEAHNDILSSPLYEALLAADKVARRLLDAEAPAGVPVEELLNSVPLTPMNCCAEAYHLLSTLRAFHAHNPWFATHKGGAAPLADNVKNYLSTLLAGAISAQGRYLMPYLMPAFLPQPTYGITR